MDNRISIRPFCCLLVVSLLTAACSPQLVKNDTASNSGYEVTDQSYEVQDVAKAEPEPVRVVTPPSAPPPVTPAPAATSKESSKPTAIKQHPKADKEIAISASSQPKPKPAKSAPPDTTTAANKRAAPPKAPLPKQSPSQIEQEAPPVEETVRASRAKPEKLAGVAASESIYPSEPASAEPVDEPQETANAADTSELAMLTEKPQLPEETLPATPTQMLTSLQLSDLPLSLSEHWTLDRRPNPVNQKTRCLLVSRPVNISDGYDRTDVQLLLTIDSLYVRTASNIDLSYPDTGVRLEDGMLLPFDGLAKQTTAVINKDVGQLYGRLTTGNSLLVKLGFWPTWPVTETQQAQFSLEGFPDGIEALQLCERM